MSSFKRDVLPVLLAVSLFLLVVINVYPHLTADYPAANKAPPVNLLQPVTQYDDPMAELASLLGPLMEDDKKDSTPER